MRFTVEVPDEVFWAVATRAEPFDQRVPDFTADMLVAVAASRAPLDSDPVLRLWREGKTDAQIAAQLGLTNLAVSDRRRRMKLPANRRAVI